MPPPRPSERIEVVDVLRGAALFGVFLVNFAGFAGRGLMATTDQLLALPTAWIDFPLNEVSRWLFEDKANTLFAFLFGFGFWLQLERQGPAFAAAYRRRLLVLLALGLAHLAFAWLWDILHLYALAGFGLLALRRLPPRAFLIGGLALAVLGRLLHEYYVSHVMPGFGWPEVFSRAWVFERQALAAAGDYPGLVGHFAAFTYWDWIAGGGLVAWFCYALGRFMLGAWTAQRGWLQDSSRHLPGFRRVLRIALPAGLILEGLARLIAVHGAKLPSPLIWAEVQHVLHFVGVPVLAAGYLAGLVVAWHHPRGQRVLSPLALVGRMALTSYVTQSFIIAFVLTGVGPGLSLAGRIGFASVAAIVVVGFVGQILVARLWLGRFPQGPLERAWRALAGRPPPGPVRTAGRQESTPLSVR